MSSRNQQVFWILGHALPSPFIPEKNKKATPSVAQEPHPLAEEVGASGVRFIHFLSTTRFTIITNINTTAKQRRRGVIEHDGFPLTCVTNL